MAVLLEHIGPTIPFPEVHGTKGERAISDEFSLRPFGLQTEDLTIDFEHAPRPWLETAILECCTIAKDGNKPARDFFWDLDVGKRTECLLAITSLSEPSREINVDLRCRNPECLEDLELAFSIQEIVGIQNPAEGYETVDVEIDDKHFSLRRPTGSDQLNWLTHSYADEITATRMVITSLLPDDQQILFDHENNHTHEWLQTINQAMEEKDPLVSFHLKTCCPSCDKQYDYYIDFGEICLKKLRAAQDRLIEFVHSLAFHYHWNEQEVFALPPWRLERYLRLIEREDKK